MCRCAIARLLDVAAWRRGAFRSGDRPASGGLGGGAGGWGRERCIGSARWTGRREDGAARSSKSLLNDVVFLSRPLRRPSHLPVERPTAAASPLLRRAVDLLRRCVAGSDRARARARRGRTSAKRKMSATASSALGGGDADDADATAENNAWFVNDLEHASAWLRTLKARAAAAGVAHARKNRRAALPERPCGCRAGPPKRAVAVWTHAGRPTPHTDVRVARRVSPPRLLSLSLSRSFALSLSVSTLDARGA